MSNISKTVTDTTMCSMEAEYETDPWAIDWHHDLWP